jgi:peroxiredoxin Q/BCP
VPLLSDENAQVCEDFGVWAEKSIYGKTYFGIVRSTFLIDGEGRIARIWRKVKVPGHAEEVLDAVKAL